MTDPTDSPDGKIASSRAADRVPGIRTKLFLSFGALVGLIVIACAIAWYAFTTIDRSVTNVTQVSVPRMTDALALAETVAEISATAPAIMASSNDEELAAERAGLERNIFRFTQLSDALNDSLYASGGDSSLENLTFQLVSHLNELNASVDRRLHLVERRSAMIATVQEVHARFLETVEPLIDDAVFDLVTSGEEVMTETGDSISGLVEEGVSDIDSLLTINAEANLAAGLMSEAINVDNPIALEPIRERFLSAYGTIERNLAQLSSGKETEALHRACDALLAFGRGPSNVFDARAAALRTGSIELRHEVQQTDAIRAKHEQFLLVLTPMIDDAAFSLVMTAEGMTHRSRDAISGLIEGGVNLLTVLLTVRAEGNLAASILSDAAGAENENLLRPLVERYTAAQDNLASLMSVYQSAGLNTELAGTVDRLLQLGRGEAGVFALRRAELQEASTGQVALNASRALSLQLGERVASLVAAIKSESDQASAETARTIGTGRIVMLLISLAGIVGAALVMFRYVDPRIIRPIVRITTAMTDLAGGDTSVDIPGRDRHDELGRMAQALGVFRDTAIAVQEANLKEIQATRRRLADAIESISEGFSLYDNEDRLVISNSRYQQLLYPDMKESLQPGTTFESILRRTVAEGYVKDAEGRAEDWIAERLARHRNPGAPHVQQRRDGRYVMVSERRTDEGGTVAVYSDITELKQRETELARKSKELEQLAGQLAKYLSPQVYESIFTGRQEVKVASQRKKLTVFFSDIADFTAMTEKLESEDLTVLLNQYLTEMSTIALSYGATIDKYVGDAIVIFFGDPESRGVKQDALSCVEMAIAMRRRMVELQAVWRRSGIEQPLECRMGINTGYCTVGNFGSEARVDYTIIGAGVNLASRMESSATPGDILISYETYAQVRDEILCEARQPITVKGISRPVATYRVIDTFERLNRQGDMVREEHPNLLIDVNLAAMTEKEREQAKDALRQVLNRLDGNKPSEDG